MVIDVAVLSDTHRDSGTGLRGRAAAAVAEADRVLHAGDFTTADVLTAHRNAASRLDAVHGNRDDPLVTNELPSSRILTVGSVKIAMTHTRRGGETGLVTWGRAQGADLVVFGHTHQPRAVDSDGVVLLNPGSHDEPRGRDPTHAELTVQDGSLTARILTVGGNCHTKVTVSARG